VLVLSAKFQIRKAGSGTTLPSYQGVDVTGSLPRPYTTAPGGGHLMNMANSMQRPLHLLAQKTARGQIPLQNLPKTEIHRQTNEPHAFHNLCDCTQGWRATQPQ
jgi:hypothetical protein